MKKIISTLLIVLLASSANIAKADFTFGEAVNVGSPISTERGDGCPRFTADGLSMYIESDRGGPWDLWLATRETINDSWGEPVVLGPTINSEHGFAPNISPDGLTLYFSSWRPGGLGQADLHVTTRASLDDPWKTPVNLGSNINSPGLEDGSQISPDGLTLYFTSERSGGQGQLDIWMTTRPTVSESWSEPVNLGPYINTPEWDFCAHVLANEHVLLFSSGRKGTFGGHDIWIAKRNTESDPWGIPMNLGPLVNSESDDRAPSLAPDGTGVYFHSDRPGGYGGFDIWKAPIFPVVDLNDDGIVDAADMCIMVDHWGTDNSLCDIGPMPWGDGIVDVEDLKVLAEHLFEEPPERPQVTTVVIVRHAERANGTLTAEGEKRAETLARLISNIGVSAIFSTNFTRTIETANNTADRLDIPIQFYTSVEGIADLIKSQYTGKVVLVVGHSNTVTQTVEALGVSSVPQFDGRYDNLYVVTIRPDGMTLLSHLRFDINPDL